jgi:hypothetical protein
MNRLLVIAITLLPLLAQPASQQKTRPSTNRPPEISSFTSSKRVLQICPWSLHFDEPEVHLVVKASDPDGDPLDFEYSNTEGTISGKGSPVLWNLDGVRRGLHEVQVTVTDGKGSKATAVLSVRTVDGSTCDPPPPPCPAVKVSIP